MHTTDDPGHLLGGNEPLHLQLREHLRAQILNHSLPPGTSLPSEAQLQARFGVSRSVVRQALGALEADGLILRGRGRGSTVAPRREHHRQVHQTSGLSTQVAGTGATVGTEVLRLSVQQSDAATSVLGTAQVISIERLRTADGVPIAVIHTWLPLPQFASLTAADLTNASLHEVMGRKFGVQIASGKRQIRAVPGDRDLAPLLGLKPASPVLLLEGTSYDADGRAVEVFSTWHHPDHVVFDIDVTAGSDSGVEPFRAPVSKDDDIRAEAVAERARILGGELLRLAGDLEALNGPDGPNS
ncbi:GntR family transcriptional regulator [Arthrobacter sp. zg-Y411]|uniref:GntR family transcriptional regulator n=1 Tax=Arthrobacter zhangbolii TaxID=2886936 RepID=UPI001D135F1F|nr:GntR family transcriptional regulator [Arthrobacter zhangbolii]MCC3295967.1 GntR family transcriptional regulator [Arthrobacter zhangbolii]